MGAPWNRRWWTVCRSCRRRSCRDGSCASSPGDCASCARASPPLRGIGGAGRVRPESGGSCRSGEKDKCFAADGGVLAGRTGAGARALEVSRRTRELDHVALKQTIVHFRHERVLDLRNSAWGWRSGGSCRSSAAPRGEEACLHHGDPSRGEASGGRKHGIERRIGRGDDQNASHSGICRGSGQNRASEAPHRRRSTRASRSRNCRGSEFGF